MPRLLFPIPRLTPAIILLSGVLVGAWTLQADERLIGGPMVAWTEMREAAVWVQTRNPERLMLAYWPYGDSDRLRESRPVESGPTPPYTATLVADRVEPGQTYEYAILVDGEPALLTYATRFATPPDYLDRTPPGEATFALLSGHYVNEAPYDPPYTKPGADPEPAARLLRSLDPDGCIWVGDTLYLRPADVGSRSGLAARYRHNRNQAGLTEILASRPHYAVWGLQDSGFAREGADYLLTEPAAQLFRAYWPARTPRPVSEGMGQTTRFRWWDAEFFLMDAVVARSTAERPREPQTVLGEHQVHWLLDALASSKARFKVVIMASPALNPVAEPPHWSFAEKEQRDFLEALQELKVPGVLFVSSGIGYGELTKTIRAQGYDLFDWTIGPMTGPVGQDNETLNYFREPGSATFERHLGTLSLGGPENDRTLTLRTYLTDGTLRWERILKAADLGY
ncbi:MAG: hypothetical protein ACFE0O_13495 [Opitutales bacterium]